ncbi:MAG: PadR family transcriptional regulator, partial [Rhodospirillales bacterium]|nr:PadR family transcriptional regulator [Rhodospirillales bacterium]
MDTRSICLGVLSLGDATGYEIKKLFEEGPFSHFFDAGYGSIYPALNKLLQDKLATCRTEEQIGRPAKKIYSITDAGTVALREALHEVPARDKIRSDALAMMFFGHMLDHDQRQLVFDKYHDHYSGVLNDLRALEDDC